MERKMYTGMIERALSWSNECRYVCHILRNEYDTVSICSVYAANLTELQVKAHRAIGDVFMDRMTFRNNIVN